MNLIETSKKRTGDGKEYSRVNLNCKWTPISFQGEHTITNIFWFTDGNSLQVRIRVVENLALIFIPITVRTEEFANFFVTLKISRTLEKKENQSLDNLLDYMDKNLGVFSEVSQINILHALVNIYDV